ncbi:MAG TPA: TIGR02452 family protein [Mycobacteriales bacterium]|nr:TIGR02452 family protein [Mycobacteriales bacterium]
MSERLSVIARETVRIVELGGYKTAAGGVVTLAEQVARAAAGTRHYEPDDEPAPSPPYHPARDPVVEVTNETSLAAARRLSLDTDDDGDVACLVFASATHPGGGFLAGAQAQEESLARASALYACQTTVPQFYGFHREQHDPRYSDRVIYSPAVPVFRADDGTLLPAPYPVSFLTAAAPNLGAILATAPHLAGSVPAVLRTRAERVLRVAGAHGHRRLVLGAWGCGVFGNDPALVAATFADALRACPRFDRVVFAVLDHQPGTPTYAAFARAFT